MPGIQRPHSGLAFAPGWRWNRRMKWIASLLLLAFCGCASKQVLAPPQVSTSDFAVNAFPNSVYLISYKGPDTLPAARVLDLALLKASQVIQQQELKYFVIIDQASSTPGEMIFRRDLPALSEWNNELMIQAFKDRPERVFCFRADATENVIYEKLRTTPERETL